MAKTKATGATRLGRDSLPKYLGIKVGEGEKVRPGMVIIRQRGTQFLPGKNAKRGNDDTIYALKEGVVRFRKKATVRFDGSKKVSRIINVL